MFNLNTLYSFLNYAWFQILECGARGISLQFQRRNNKPIQINTELINNLLKSIMINKYFLKDHLDDGLFVSPHKVNRSNPVSGTVPASPLCKVSLRLVVREY